MARATLTVNTLQPDNAVLNLSTNSTTTVTAGASNGVQFNNGGSTFLIVNQAGTTASTLTVNVGTTLLGQSVTLSATIPGTVGTYAVGPFHSAVNQLGSGQVAIDFSSATGLTVGAFQPAGVY